MSDAFHKTVTFEIYEDDGCYFVETFWASWANQGEIVPASEISCAGLIDLLREKLIEGPPSYEDGSMEIPPEYR